MKVVIIMGSDKDQSHVDKITASLKELEVPVEEHILSAHKVPEKVLPVLEKYNQESDVCFITVAGRSNALSGLVAANTVHPCLGCPPFSDKHDMILNLNSTMIMPSETPVLAVIDPVNAALAAARILALNNPELKEKLTARLAQVKSSFK